MLRIVQGKAVRMHIVFAYGSNLRFEQMRARCPGVRIVGTATLPDHRLVFGGKSPAWGGSPVASVVPCRGRRVPGVLYEVPDVDLARLDRFEGHPTVYRRVSMQVIAQDSEWYTVQVYRMVAAELAAPFVRYFAAVLDGYKSWGFDPNVLAVACRYSRKKSRPRRTAQEPRAAEAADRPSDGETSRTGQATPRRGGPRLLS